LRLLLFFEDVEVVVIVVRDMAGILRNRRGKGQRVEPPMWGFEEETRKQTERAVRRRSGREGRVVCVGGGNISTAACGGEAMMRRVGGACVDGKVHGGKNRGEWSWGQN